MSKCCWISARRRQRWRWRLQSVPSGSHTRVLFNNNVLLAPFLTHSKQTRSCERCWSWQAPPRQGVERSWACGKGFAIHWHLHRPTRIGVVNGASILHSGTAGNNLTAVSDNVPPHWLNSHTLGQFKGQAVAYRRACDAANPVSGGLCSNTVPLCIASTA